MALKAFRQINASNMHYISAYAIEDGAGLILDADQPTGSGVGQLTNETSPVASQPTGQALTSKKFLGISQSRVVDLDLSIYPRNSLQPMTQVVGEPISVVTDGELLTDQITGTPAIEATAYLQIDGTFGDTQVNSLASVGKFKSAKDADGFALVAIKVT